MPIEPFVSETEYLPFPAKPVSCHPGKRTRVATVSTNGLTVRASAASSIS